MYTKWITIFEDPCITGCVDPLTDCIMDKIQFHDVYRPILEQLDGHDYAQSVEFFFTLRMQHVWALWIKMQRMILYSGQ
jgi:hypothetical protein